MKKHDYINSDNNFYNKFNTKQKLQLILRNDHWIYINRYLRFLRLEEYHYNKSGIYHKIMSFYWARRKNNLGIKLGFHINPNSLGLGATIYHHGSIIINGDARIGKNCILHGMNCIGNKGEGTGVPTIGDNVDIGVGAMILGNITIANNCKIGANAVVVKSCNVENAVLVGVPATIQNKDND